MKTVEKWVQIPCAPKYEINKSGKVRNIESGKIVTPWIPKDRVADKQVFLRIETGDKKSKGFHVSSLLWLTHGIIQKRKTHLRIVVPVIVSRGNQSYHFDSCRQAAKFLAKCDGQHTAGTVVHLLSRRTKEIFGWKINYQR